MSKAETTESTLAPPVLANEFAAQDFAAVSEAGSPSSALLSLQPLLSSEQKTRVRDCLQLYHQARDSEAASGLVRIVYEHVNPSKLASMDQLLAECKGQELQFLRHVARKYSIDLKASFPEFFIKRQTTEPSLRRTPDAHGD